MEAKNIRKSHEERKKDILKAAKALFLEKGFNFTAKETAAKNGITETLVFHHFPTKKDLIREIYEDHFSAIKPSESIPAKAAAESIQKDLIDYFVRFYRNAEESRTLEMLYLYALEKSDNKPENPVFAKLSAGLADPLVRYFQSGIEKGIFQNSKNPEIMAEMIHNVFFHFIFFQCILKRAELNDAELLEKTSLYIDLFLNGVLDKRED